MCGAPKPQKIEIPEPQYMRNPYLDDTRSDLALVRSLRSGRNSLRIPLDTGLGVGFSSRGGVQRGTQTLGPRGNARPGSNPLVNKPIKSLSPTPVPASGNPNSRSRGNRKDTGLGRLRLY